MLFFKKRVVYTKLNIYIFYCIKGRRGRNRMVVVSLNPVHGDVHSMQHDVLRFVSDLRQVGVFLLVLRFPPPIKLTATI